MIPEKTADERCARCDCVIPRSWFGRLRLDVTVPREVVDEVQPALQKIGADLGRTLCWTCLGKAVEVFCAWRDEAEAAG